MPPCASVFDSLPIKSSLITQRLQGQILPPAAKSFKPPLLVSGFVYCDYLRVLSQFHLRLGDSDPEFQPTFSKSFYAQIYASKRC